MLSFKDEAKLQYFGVASAQPASWFKVVVNDVYKGSKYRDTCIAELEVE